MAVRASYLTRYRTPRCDTTASRRLPSPHSWTHATAALALASQLRRKYASNAYANARYGLHCRAVLQATMPGPKAVPAWVDTWQRIRIRLTLGVSVLVVLVSVVFRADAVVEEGATS